MRASMQFQVYANTYAEAKAAAVARVASFLEVPKDDVDDYASIELVYNGTEMKPSIDVYVRITHV